MNDKVKQIAAEQIAAARRQYPQYPNATDAEVLALRCSNYEHHAAEALEVLSLNARQASALARADIRA